MKKIEPILELWKEEGETPLECIERFKKENTEYKDEKMTYAGRLDPMAEGILLVLVGDECKKKEKYLDLDKEYEFEILWGFRTDTYDVLGLVTENFNLEKIIKIKKKEEELKKKIKKLKGKFVQPYPPYSSKTFKGKKLFQWARKGKIQEIKIPERMIEIYEIQFLESRNITRKNLLKNIVKRIQKVSGDFRQEKIIAKWKRLLKDNSKSENSNYFLISKLKMKCSSGTYVRGIADKLGKDLGINLVTFSIKRIRIGKFRGIEKIFY